MSERKMLTVSASPHFRSNRTTSGIMLDVIIALIPALVAACFIFGYRSLIVTVVSVITCVLAEYLSRKVMKRDNTINDLSAVVTGILLAYNLPAGIPLWMVVFGGIVAIVVVKQMFGGIGQNFINPALTARIVLLAAFPGVMSTWQSPIKSGDTYISAVTSASPMALLKTIISKGDISADSFSNGTVALPTLKEMFLGIHSGCLGEVCAAALLLGGIYLVVRKVISPIIPLVYVGTVAFIMIFAGHEDLIFLAYEILGGGLLLGAIFMATDYTTSPLTVKGKVIYAIGCGLITCLIRLFGHLPEGVSFSIILMNIFVPHIENLTTPKPFGTEKDKKEKKKEEVATV